MYAVIQGRLRFPWHYFLLLLRALLYAFSLVLKFHSFLRSLPKLFSTRVRLPFYDIINFLFLSLNFAIDSWDIWSLLIVIEYCLWIQGYMAASYLYRSFIKLSQDLIFYVTFVVYQVQSNIVNFFRSRWNHMQKLPFIIK